MIVIRRRSYRKKLLTKTLRNLKGLLVFTLLTLNTVFWVIPLLLVALLKLVLPVATIRDALTLLLMRIAENWVSVNAQIFGYVNETRWDLRGFDNLSRREWYLVIVNHQTWVDIVVLQTALNRKIPLLKFFIKKQLIWFPFLGAAFWALDMPFMQRHSKSYLAKHPEEMGSDRRATREACERFRDVPTSVMNFIEGTRFSEEKRDNRKSPYRNLLAPRPGGVAMALSSMGAMFTSVLDITVVYPRRTAQFWDMVCGELSDVIVDIRRRPIEQWMVDGDYDGDREHRRRVHQWLRDIWTEKDLHIETLRVEDRAE